MKHDADCATHALDVCDCTGTRPKPPLHIAWTTTAHIAHETGLPIGQVRELLASGRTEADLLELTRT